MPPVSFRKKRETADHFHIPPSQLMFGPSLMFKFENYIPALMLLQALKVVNMST